MHKARETGAATRQGSLMAKLARHFSRFKFGQGHADLADHDIQLLEDEVAEITGPDTQPQGDLALPTPPGRSLPWRPPAEDPEPAVAGVLEFTFAGHADARGILGNAHSLRSEMRRTRGARALLDVRGAHGPVPPDAGLLLSSVLTTLLAPASKVAVLRLDGPHGKGFSGASSGDAVRIAEFVDRERALEWLAGRRVRPWGW